MKVAYHFKCTEIEGRYDQLFYKKIFTERLNLNHKAGLHLCARPSVIYLSLDLAKTDFMPSEPTPLEWLLLRIIDQIPMWTNMWTNDYRLERLFAKTDECLSIFESLRGLVKKSWLNVKYPKAQVKEYNTTEESRRLLAEGYNTFNIRNYVVSIEPTGFILGILEKMDANSPRKT